MIIFGFILYSVTYITMIGILGLYMYNFRKLIKVRNMQEKNYEEAVDELNRRIYSINQELMIRDESDLIMKPFDKVVH